ncbi:MAG: T9SS type A sorting domain-containing protein [Rhodothermales bacterium]|nr:T9SS type A sorting domain-containing protein [Rhodothermales bacterium]
MHTATTRVGWVTVLLLFLAASPARAQEYDITFQVDMTSAIETCNFDPAENTVTVPGNFNGWDNTQFPLADDDADGIYTGTYTIAEGDLTDPAGEMAYKFYGTPDAFVGWEDDPNRTFDPTEDTVLDVVEFNKTFTDACSATEDTYQVVFQVDMSVQEALGNFDPATDDVFAAGQFNGWNTSATQLQQSTSDPDVYVGVAVADLVVPSTQPYKYIIEYEDGSLGWENDPNKTFEVTGNETDQDQDGNPEVFVPLRFFNNTSDEDILSEPAMVTFNVDLRSAFEVLENEGQLPANADGTQFVEEINGLFVNGPIVGASTADEVGDWAAWGPGDGELGSLESRQLADPDEDGIYTATYEYEAGTVRNLPGKFGTDGYDNEAAGFNDHFFRIDPGMQTIDLVFGCMRKEGGTFEDDNGPGNAPVYDPYALIDNGATPPTCVFVETGGEADNPVSVEPTGEELPVSATLSGAYPNPSHAGFTFEYALPKTAEVHLAVYDLLGRKVATLVDGVQPANTYRVGFDAAGLAAGVYVYRLNVDGTVLAKRLTVVE